MLLHGMVRDAMHAKALASQPGRRCDAGSNPGGVGMGRQWDELAHPFRVLGVLGFRGLGVFGFSSDYLRLVANKHETTGCKQHHP